MTFTGNTAVVGGAGGRPTDHPAATSAFFRATQFVSPAAVSAGRHASARSSPATSAVEGAETESYAG